MKKDNFVFLLLALLSIGASTLLGQIQLGNNILGAAAYDRSGISIAFAQNGNRIAIGAIEHIVGGVSTGHARVFDWVNGAWTQVGNDVEGEGASDKFGISVALSVDGSILAVGGDQNSNANGNGAGHVRVYKLLNGSWTQLGSDIDGEAAGDGSGYIISLSASGSRVAIGAAGNDGNGVNSGHTRVYDWNGTNWVQAGTDIDGEAAGDFSGFWVKLSADGNILAISAPKNDGNGINSGHVRIYRWTGSGWVQKGSDIDGEGIGDQSGTSIYLSADGNRIAIGAENNTGPNGQAGHARIFSFLHGNWVQMGGDIDGEVPRDDFGYSIALSAEGDRVAVGTPNHDGNGTNSGYLKVFQWYGMAWKQLGKEIEGDSAYHSLATYLDVSSDGKRLAAGSPQANNINGIGAGHVNVFTLSDQYKEITGKIGMDANSNCLIDSTESPIKDVPILFHDGRIATLDYSDASGKFLSLVDTGSYLVSLDLGSYPYWRACPPQQQIIVDTQTTQISGLDFTVQPFINCPYLTVYISTPRIRRCFPGKYTVVYANNGTVDAANSYIDIQLDPSLRYDSASVPLILQSGNLLRFQLDSVKVGKTYSFTLHFRENCRSGLSQIHCTSAHIYPDSICLTEIPNITVSDSCLGDTLVYRVINLADDFPHPLPYLILDDSAVVDTGSLLLNRGQSKNIDFFYQDTAKMYQLVLAPQDSIYHMATGLTGCKPTAANTNFVYLPQTPHAFYLDTDCTQNTGSFDPNDKQAYPLGQGSQNIIPPNFALAYTIRFQNTGTDTAFFVNIIDTLSPHLDFSTIVPGTSSHPYAFAFLSPTDSGQQVIHFEFDPILLPDSGANQEGSNGYVKFLINMKPHIPLGTIIENKAAIYFDYNDPIITNTYVHTVQIPDSNICQDAQGTERVTVCRSFRWIDGKTYTSNQTATYRIKGGAYTGCDSVVSLQLTVNQPVSDTFFITACDSFTWLDGITYLSSNSVATHTLSGAASNGCDSIITLNLNLNTSAPGTDVITSCDPYTWIDGNTYTQSNTSATFTLTGGARNGCDSLLSLQLSIDTVDVSVSDQSPILRANAPGLTYQWVDCQNAYTAIPEATEQLFSPSLNGLYAVIVSNENCTDTSACYQVGNVGFTNNDFGKALQVFPNPTNSQLSIDLGNTYREVHIRITNGLGQVVFEQKYDKLHKTKTELAGSPGIYLLEITTRSGKMALLKVIRN